MTTRNSQIINQVFNECCMETMSRIEDKSVQLIIADPPYFEVKGDFDFIWDSFDDYLKDVEMWAKEFKRILADNGSLYVYGHAKKIAYKQIIFDRYFNLENNLIWHKTDCQTRKGIEEFRSYAPVTERILFYSNEIEATGLQIINNDLELYSPIRDYFKKERSKTSYSYKEINEKCFNTASNGGGMASNILTSYKDGWSFPTQEKYEALQKIGICQKPYEELRKEYEELRKEYEYLRRPFDNKEFTDVLEFSQESHITRKYKHDTKKPNGLTKALIEVSSRKNDLVYIPFGGSGTEISMCETLERRYIGSELDENHFQTIQDRIKEHKGEIGLFA